MRVIKCTLFSLFLSSTTARASMELNLTKGVTPISHEIYNLHMTIFWICVVIGIIVFGVMFYSIINHRKARGVKPASFHEHLWVEIIWSIIPIIILIVMAIPATLVLKHIRETDQPDLTIKITGFQWKWRYEYLDQGVQFFSNNATPLDQINNKLAKDSTYLQTVDRPLVLPIHKKIRFLITSNDVMHSWWVRDLGVKQDAIPGYIIESWTRINRPGTYHGQCAELCGLNHAYMPIVVIALADEDFKNWVAQQKGGSISISPPPVVTVPTAKAAMPKETGTPKLSMTEMMQKGQQIYNTTCAVCHQMNGEGMPPVYPALKGGKITTGPAASHINRVLFGKTGTAMQAFKDQFSDEDLAAVITFERNSWGNKAKTVGADQVKAARAAGPIAE